MTEQARSLEKEINESFQKEKERNIAYIRTYPTLVGLCLYKYWLFREIGIFKSQPSLSNIPMFEEIFENLYKEQYASHPYIKEIGNNLADLQLKRATLSLTLCPRRGGQFSSVVGFDTGKVCLAGSVVFLV